MSSYNQGSADFPWPRDLVAFWDFSEPQAPYCAKAGADRFRLEVGGTAPVQVDAAPFGKGLRFNGASDYLIIPSDEVGALNVAERGDEVTVVAWVNFPDALTNGSFVAGMWQEDNCDPKRQYGLFANLPTYGGRSRCCGHVSKTGGASPNLPYSRDYSASGAVLAPGIQRCIGFTYDGEWVKSYVDGISDVRSAYTEPSAPTGEGHTYGKNPYAFDLGMNRGSVSDFTVGAVRLTAGMGNWFNGILCGLAVFSRALSSDEMMKLHLSALSQTDAIQHFNFAREPGTGSVPLKDYGWTSAAGSTAKDSSSEAVSWALERANTASKSYLCRSTRTAGNDTTQAIAVHEGIKNIRIGQISAATFLLNNDQAGNLVRLCLKVDGQWYATAATFDSGHVGASGADWTAAVLQTVEITRDKSAWLELSCVPGSTLSVGVHPANDLPDGEVTGIGFLSEPLAANGILRVTDLKLYS